MISSIPVHSMSTIALPKFTLDELDKIARTFLWGSTTEQRKQHLISWKKVYLPKKEGGLGIRSSRDMNTALLAKIGWRLLEDKTSLWAKVLRSKYKVKVIYDPTWIVVKRNWSSTWRSIGVGLREVVIPGLSLIVGDGKTIRFWKDKWLLGVPLKDRLSGFIQAGEEDTRVCELWRRGTGWNLDRILPYVSMVTRLRLTAVVVDEWTCARDGISWGESPDGKFTISSAYQFLTRDATPRQNLSSLFERVWKVIVPERVKIFLRLGVNQVIMTNMERYRRHLSENGICQVCKSGEETIIHVLLSRDEWIMAAAHSKT